MQNKGYMFGKKYNIVFAERQRKIAWRELIKRLVKEGHDVETNPWKIYVLNIYTL